MGWFLKSAGRTGSKKSRQGVRNWPPRSAQHTLGILKGLSLGIAVVLILAGWHTAKQYLLQQAAGHTAAYITESQINLVNAPYWMDKLVASHVRRIVAMQLSDDVLDTGALHTALAVLEDDSWVRRVHRIRRKRNAQVDVWAEYRQPVAVVGNDHGFFRVDREGVQLPGLFVKSQLAALGLPVIIGVRTLAPGEGSLWLGMDIQDGLTLAAVVADKPYAAQIQAIDVSLRDRRGRTRLALLTRNGQVRWGLGPGRSAPIEPDTTVKLRRIAKVYAKWRAIDAGGKIVDVYGPNIFISQAPPRRKHVQTGY